MPQLISADAGLLRELGVLNASAAAELATELVSRFVDTSLRLQCRIGEFAQTLILNKSSTGRAERRSRSWPKVTFGSVRGAAQGPPRFPGAAV